LRVTADLTCVAFLLSLWGRAVYARACRLTAVGRQVLERAKEMEALIRRWNGEPFIAPSVQERAIDSHAEALDLLPASNGIRR